MTVAELVDLLKKCDQTAKVVSFHDDIRTVTHQIQEIHAVNSMNTPEIKFVIIQAQQLQYEGKLLP